MSENVCAEHPETEIDRTQKLLVFSSLIVLRYPVLPNTTTMTRNNFVWMNHLTLNAKCTVLLQSGSEKKREDKNVS